MYGRVGKVLKLALNDEEGAPSLVHLPRLTRERCFTQRDIDRHLLPSLQGQDLRDRGF